MGKGKKMMKRKRAMALLLAIPFLFGALAMPALAEEGKSDERILIEQEAGALAEMAEVYQIQIKAAAKKTEQKLSPSLISYVLDGSTNMEELDAEGVSKGTRARQALLQSFKALMDDNNLNKENTFINIIMYKEQADAALSLTRWAGQANPAFADLDAANHLSEGGLAADYLPLLDPSGSGKINPLLAQLLYCDYEELKLKGEDASGEVEKAYPISAAFYYGRPSASETMEDAAESSKASASGAMQLAMQAMELKMQELQSGGVYDEEQLLGTHEYLMLLLGAEDASAEETTEQITALETAAAHVWLLSMGEDEAYQTQSNFLQSSDAKAASAFAVEFAGEAVAAKLPRKVMNVKIEGQIPEHFMLWASSGAPYPELRADIGSAELKDDGSFVWIIDSMEEGTTAQLQYELELDHNLHNDGQKYDPLGEIKVSVEEGELLGYANVNPANGFEIRLDELPTGLRTTVQVAEISTPKTATALDANGEEVEVIEVLPGEELPEAVSVEVEEMEPEPMPPASASDKTAGQPTPNTGEGTVVAVGIVIALLMVSVVVYKLKQKSRAQ